MLVDAQVEHCGQEELVGFGLDEGEAFCEGLEGLGEL